MNARLACTLIFTAVLALSTASAQTGDRRMAVPGGPAIARTQALTNAELSARVTQLEAQVAQLAFRVEMLNEQMGPLQGYPTHRHNFNDNVSVGAAAHDVTGPPHQ